MEIPSPETRTQRAAEAHRLGYFSSLKAAASALEVLPCHRATGRPSNIQNLEDSFVMNVNEEKALIDWILPWTRPSMLRDMADHIGQHPE